MFVIFSLYILYIIIKGPFFSYKLIIFRFHGFSAFSPGFQSLICLIFNKASEKNVVKVCLPSVVSTTAEEFDHI